jgi:crotonobetainyl-CoA:carnitine CoA-transferase CaiB-like acyl-CoA transferase
MGQTILAFTLIDFTDQRLAFAARILADLGALVVRVEGKGHPQVGPGYVLRNMNKHVMRLNLEREEGREVFLRLIKRAHALIDGAGSFACAISKEPPTELNPSLVHVSLKADGKGGLPDDYVVSASAGQMAAMGEGVFRSLPPGQNYYVLCLYGAIAVLLGLEKRDREGKGLYLELSLEECAISVIEDVLVRYRSGRAGAERGVDTSNNGLICTVDCKDGPFQIALPYGLETMMELLAADGIIGEPMEEGKGHGVIARAIKQWAASRTRNELFEMGQSMRLPFAPILSPFEVRKNVHLRSRRFIRQVKTEWGKHSIPSMPYRFSPSGRLKFRPPTPITDRLCKELLGLSDREFVALKDGGVL